jgi:hypothetical protein
MLSGSRECGGTGDNDLFRHDSEYPAGFQLG